MVSLHHKCASRRLLANRPFFREQLDRMVAHWGQLRAGRSEILVNRRHEVHGCISPCPR